MHGYIDEPESVWQPQDCLKQLKERESSCREMMELLEDRSRYEGCLWAHHLPRLLDMLEFFADLLKDEIEHFGEWRYHELQADELTDLLEDDLNELARWISRMTDIRPANDEDSAA